MEDCYDHHCFFFRISFQKKKDFWWRNQVWNIHKLKDEERKED